MFFTFPTAATTRTTDTAIPYDFIIPFLGFQSIFPDLDGLDKFPQRSDLIHWGCCFSNTIANLNGQFLLFVQDYSQIILPLLLIVRIYFITSKFHTINACSIQMHIDRYRIIRHVLDSKIIS